MRKTGPCFNSRNYPFIPSNLKHSVNKRICNEGKQFIFELTSESIFRINYNKCDKYIRRFTLNEKEFIIEDDFLINKPCKYELSINFSENFKIKRIDQKSLHVSNKKNKFIIKNNTNYSINNSTYSESYNSQKSGTSIIFTKKINKKFKNRFRIKLFS